MAALSDTSATKSYEITIVEAVAFTPVRFKLGRSFGSQVQVEAGGHSWATSEVQWRKNGTIRWNHMIIIPPLARSTKVTFTLFRDKTLIGHAEVDLTEALAKSEFRLNEAAVLSLQGHDKETGRLTVKVAECHHQLPMTEAVNPANGEKVWFITGASSGFGLRLVESALAKGDFVIATARNLGKLDAVLKQGSMRLYRMQLDVTDGEVILKAKLKEAAQIWGRLDVCVNNARFGMSGLIEECGSGELKNQFRTNVFGLLDVTTAVLPHMRKQRSGTIVIFSSRMMWEPETAGANLYSQSKASVNVLGETLAVEVAPFGIKVLIVLPGSFRTNIMSGDVYQGNKIPDYDPMRKTVEDMFHKIPGTQPGDPAKAVEIVVDVVRGEGVAEKKEWPLYLPLGRDAESAFREKSQKITKVMDEWAEVIRSTDFDSETEMNEKAA